MTSGKGAPGDRTSIRRATFAASLVVLLAAGAGTRLHRLGDWGLSGDELYTLRDSLEPNLFLLEQPVQFLLNRPLIYLLNHHLIAPYTELGAGTLRLFPVIFGILGIAALVLVGRRLVGDRAALLAGLLLVFSPWHLVHSQFARYYSLVFLLAAISPAALYLGARHGSRAWTAAGVGCVVAGWLAHPTAVLPTAGFLVWAGIVLLRRAEGRRRTLVLWSLVATAALGVVLGGILLSRWAALEQEWGIGGVWVAVSWTSRLGAGPAIAAAVGATLAWLDGRRELSLFLALAVLVPVTIIGLLGQYVAVHTGYLFATAPYALLAAGYGLDRIARAFATPVTRGVAAGGVAAVVVASTLPGFASHYLDGSRPDFRGAAEYVAERAGPADSVLTDHPMSFKHYEPSLAAASLERSPAVLDTAYRSVRAGDPPGSLWIVPYVRTEGGFGVRGLGAVEEWVRRRCVLEEVVGAHRLDHELNLVPVWRCPGPRVGPPAGRPGRTSAG